ncbi:MAG: Gfo/Idh/MocA family oxidoreductase, partial [Pirellulaceae bacterium]|nr:Gfo/Idh/MocA family oxidoreductase [Pirellulaceae bacterium]
LLADRRIQVVDVGVPPDVQLEVIREIVRHNAHIRGVLAQKPLGVNYAEAVEVVRLCEEAGVTLAVNQNMRYDQSVRACKCLLDRGYLGAPVFASIDMRAIPHWMPWQQRLGWVTLRIMSIHHLDAFRYWFGDPVRVFASVREDPRTARKFPHDWRVEGMEGMARGTIGWPDYPHPTPSTLDFTTTRQPGYWLQPRWREVWFPDAFVGTMAQLLCALEDNTEPEISGRDNLKTMALVEACYVSAREHRAVEIGEIEAANAFGVR